MSIKLTQLLKPSGKTVGVEIEASEDIEKMANQLVDLGYRFKVEQLIEGDVQIDCSKSTNDPIAIELCQNGPSLIEAIFRLIKTSHSKVFSKKIEIYDEDENPVEFWR